MIKELSANRIAGPFISPPFINFRVSPLGLVPKKEANSCRLIYHLSFPVGYSLNDEIDPLSASVKYATFDDAVYLIKTFGRGALLAKASIKSVFILLPIAPESYNSLGFCFDGYFFYDKCLPMGCSLSCFYFEAFASFLQWVMIYESGHNGIIHYLYDFLFVCPSNSLVCSLILRLFFLISKFFGIPLAPEKTAFPSPIIEFLDIRIDTLLFQFELPALKIDRLQSCISTFVENFFIERASIFFRSFAFATRIMPMGRIFCRLLSLLCLVSNLLFLTFVSLVS